MKTAAVVKKDPRLLFFQALDSGLHNGLIKGSFIETLEKEVAEMGLRFAERYYSIIYQAYLEQAVKIVLGIINLGLYKESQGDLDIALKKITEHGALNLFRLGWSQVEALVKTIEKVDSAEKEEEFGPNINLAALMAEAVANHFAMEAEEIWNGVEEYRQLCAKYGALAEQQEFQRWFIKRFWKKNQMPFYAPETEIKTIFASLLVAETAHAPINLADCQKIAETIKQQAKLKQYFLEKTDVIKKIVPVQWLKIFNQETEQFYRLTLLPAKKKNYRPEEFVSFCRNEFDIDLEPASYDQQIFNETVKIMEEYSDAELLEMLSGTIDDPIARMAMVECITTRKKLTSKDILTLLRDVPLGELVGQIQWHEIDWKTIERVMISESLNKIARGILLQDIYQSAVLNPTEVKKDWWSKMPLSLAFPIFLAIDPADRPTLLEKTHLPVEEIRREVFQTSDLKCLALVKPEDWYDIWIEFEPVLTGKKLLAFLSDEEHLLPLSSTEKINYLARIVESIAQEWQKRPELRQYASPFRAEGLKGAIKSILDDKEFERLLKKLKATNL